MLDIKEVSEIFKEHAEVMDKVINDLIEKNKNNPDHYINQENGRFNLSKCLSVICEEILELKGR